MKKNKVMRINDINEMADADIRKNEINKLAENYEIQFIKKQLENIEYYKMGYNCAKETLYTKEQIIEVIELARLIDYNGSNDYYMSEDEIIKALKP